MRVLRAGMLGAMAGAVLAYVCAAIVSMALAAASADASLAFGPLHLFSVTRTADGTETTIGTALLVVPLAAAIANAVAALLLGRKAR